MNWESEVEGFLVAQWLRIHLKMQGTQVWSLVWEDLTCLGATKSMCDNYWASVLKPRSCSYWPHTLEPSDHNKGSHCSEKPAHAPRNRAETTQPWRPSTAENKYHFKINLKRLKRVHRCSGDYGCARWLCTEILQPSDPWKVWQRSLWDKII